MPFQSVKGTCWKRNFSRTWGIAAAVMEMMQALKTDGMSDADHGSLVKYYEKMAKIKVKQ
jgi:hypothetical protein